MPQLKSRNCRGVCQSAPELYRMCRGGSQQIAILSDSGNSILYGEEGTFKSEKWGDRGLKALFDWRAVQKMITGCVNECPKNKIVIHAWLDESLGKGTVNLNLREGIETLIATLTSALLPFIRGIKANFMGTTALNTGSGEGMAVLPWQRTPNSTEIFNIQSFYLND